MIKLTIEVQGDIFMLKYSVENDVNYIYFDSIKTIRKANDLIMLLDNISKTANHKVVFDFTKMKQQSYTGMHVMIAGVAQYYIENKGFEISFNEKDGMYIAHTSVKNPLPIKSNIDSVKDDVFDKVLVFEDSEDVSLISDLIINQLKYKYDFGTGVLAGIGWCMNEIMDNVFNHSYAARGYIMAQVHRRNKIVSISVYDTGRGLFQSITESKEYNPKYEEEAIELCVMKGVTGDRSVGQGTGMWGLYNILKENRGHLTIATGHTAINYDFESGRSAVSKKIPILSNDNLSTRIDFTFHFKNSININAILENYATFENINRTIDDMMMESGWIDFKVKDESKCGYGTRQAGKALKHHLLNMSNYMSNYDEHPMLIDFESIDIITSSFADEFIGRLVQEIGIDNFNSRFKIINCNEDVLGLISKAIVNRKC